MSARLERVVETSASGLGNGIGWLASHGVLFGLFAVIWIAFGAALVRSPGSLDEAWRTLTGLPLVVQAAVWLLLLPVTIGLWAWETDWPLAVRLVLVVSLAAWNLLMFLPRRDSA